MGLMQCLVLGVTEPHPSAPLLLPLFLLPFTLFPLCTSAQRSDMRCHTMTADTTSYGNKHQGQRKDVPITKSPSDQQTDSFKLPRRHLIVPRQPHLHVYKWKDGSLWRRYFGKISSSLCPQFTLFKLWTFLFSHLAPPLIPSMSRWLSMLGLAYTVDSQ